MPSTRFLPPASLRDRIRPRSTIPCSTPLAPRRSARRECGTPRRISGTPGSSPTHSTLPFRRDAVERGAWDTVQLMRAETVAEFTRRQNIPAGLHPRTRLGYAVDSGYSSAGRQAVAALLSVTPVIRGRRCGWTRSANLFIVLLTNRVNPTRANMAILHVRAHVADLVADALTPPRALARRYSTTVCQPRRDSHGR